MRIGKREQLVGRVNLLKIYQDIAPDGHAAEILAALEKLRASQDRSLSQKSLSAAVL